jgi:hypothetical protein
MRKLLPLFASSYRADGSMAVDLLSQEEPVREEPDEEDEDDDEDDDDEGSDDDGNSDGYSE